MSDNFSGVKPSELRQIVHALLREWGGDVAIAERGIFVDFHVTSALPLGVPQLLRYRLFLQEVTTNNLLQLQLEAAAQSRVPIAIATQDVAPDATIPTGMTIIRPNDLIRLSEESGVLARSDSGQLQVDRVALRELKDSSNASFAFVNGLLHLRSLARNRTPPPLRWTGIPAYELFERCFFLIMTTTFRGRGESWGTKHRGKPFPDGKLNLPNSEELILYDCKAARSGYQMTYRDLTGFADYLREYRKTPAGATLARTPRFLVVSSEILGGSRDASFARRHKALLEKVPGASLAWMRASDLARFGLAIEQAEVSPEVRELIQWGRLLDTGDIRWDAFANELQLLSERGYNFAEAV